MAKLDPSWFSPHTKAHTASEDGASSVNKRARNNRLVLPRAYLPQRQDNTLATRKGASSG